MGIKWNEREILSGKSNSNKKKIQKKIQDVNRGLKIHFDEFPLNDMYFRFNFDSLFLSFHLQIFRSFIASMKKNVSFFFESEFKIHNASNSIQLLQVKCMQTWKKRMKTYEWKHEMCSSSKNILEFKKKKHEKRRVSYL